MIKIIYFLNSTTRGGVEEHVLRLMGGLDKERFEPVVVCPGALLDLMGEDIEALKIRAHAVNLRRWWHIGEIKKFLAVLKEEKPTIVHSHLFRATMFAAPLSKCAGVPKVIETAHIREAWRKGIKKAYCIDRFFYRFVDKIIAVSKAVKGYLVDEKGVPAQKIEVIYNGVDVEKFSSRDTVHSPQSGNRKFTIGVIGRLEPQKGHRYFLEAVTMLGDKGKDIDFRIIGDGILRHELERMARDFGIDDRVRFLGYQKDMREVIATFDLVVLPSLYEGLPLVILEAGAMGKPVIATDVDGSGEAVIDGETGILVGPGDSDALKEAMERCLTEKEALVRFGKAGREHVARSFTSALQIDNTEKLYDALCVKRQVA